jgi:hypothetical protein
MTCLYRPQEAWIFRRRSNEDKRRAVQTLLSDPEWSGWSDREIVRRCGVAPSSVGALRPKPVTVQVGQLDPEVITATARAYTDRRRYPAIRARSSGLPKG